MLVYFCTNLCIAITLKKTNRHKYQTPSNLVLLCACNFLIIMTPNLHIHIFMNEIEDKLKEVLNFYELLLLFHIERFWKASRID
jgi:hypothetical protein